MYLPPAPIYVSIRFAVLEVLRLFSIPKRLSKMLVGSLAP